MIWLGLVIGLFIGAILAILLYSCLIVAKEADERIEERTSIMNKVEATAYAVMAINTLQNSANGDYKLRDIKLTDIEDEMKMMFKIYKRIDIIELAEKVKK